MPVNLSVPESLPVVKGVSLSGISAGLKKNGDRDLVLMTFAPGSVTAGVFTKNSFCAAPVTVCREHLNRNNGQVSSLLINSGGANAATGETGLAMARQTCDWVKERLNAIGYEVDAQSVLPFSTGVIGEQLPRPKFETGIPALVDALSPNGWMDAAHGIMTTDILPKAASRTLTLSGQTITLNGIAKGSGMIQPDMATMLAFIATDAAVAAEPLQALLADVVERTFNSVTVDGDTSTNDSCMLTATGASGVELSPQSTDWPEFTDAVLSLSLELAQAIVRDGEGATKFITINVTGGRTTEECKKTALTVGNSPLVKTAFFASDANLGRIIMAVGRSSETLTLDTFSLRLDDVDVLIKGQPADTYTEERGHSVMQKPEIDINIDLGQGSENWSVWTCDFSHEYVTINSDYRS